MVQIKDIFDSSVEATLEVLTQHGEQVFARLRVSLDAFFGGIDWILTAPPFGIIAVVFGLLGWRTVNLAFGIVAMAGLALCQAMGLWPQTMSTLALVAGSTVLALLIAVPTGIVAGLSPTVQRWLELVLDFIQTMPPYIYLLPGIALIGYGVATAMCATVLVAIPPALRLTALGIHSTPLEAVELGTASGASTLQQLAKIRIPFAMPSIVAGINQSLMMAFGMVVIAGIVGSEGLGETVYGAIRTLEIGKSIDAGLAIVILTIVLDRISSGAIGQSRRNEA